jgi:hypothetical protein
MATNTVLISKLTGNPEIRVGITTTGIEIEILLTDFLTALLKEVGSPAGVFRRAELERRVRDAALVVVRGMKAETARVV